LKGGKYLLERLQEAHLSEIPLAFRITLTELINEQLIFIEVYQLHNECRGVASLWNNFTEKFLYARNVEVRETIKLLIAEAVIVCQIS
jgi:hypothetical protein